MKKRLHLIILLIVFCCIIAKGQTNNIFSKAETFHKVLPIEKLYLTTDKSYYNAGDTLWFKSYLLNTDLSASKQSDKIYIELFNDSLTYIEKRTIALNNGLGYGDFALKNNLREGTYILRAYSNWQQNFGSDYFFQKSFYIGNASEKTWLIDSYQKLVSVANKKTLDLKIRLTNIKNEAVGLKDVEVYLLNGTKRVMKADLQTSLQGSITTQIPLGDNKINGDYSFVIVDKLDKTRKSVLPIQLNEQDEIDLQFMPEGGHLVNDIYSKVALKALNANGKGKQINGNIVNEKNEIITSFNSSQRGMGSFFIFPKKESNYFANYTLNGKEHKVPLPSAKDEGTTLRIDHLSKPDSVIVYLKASTNKKLDHYLLLAQTAGEAVLSANINLKIGISVIKLAKKELPTGILYFTLFSPEQKPLNERQLFIDNSQSINISLKTHKNTYTPKDSVAVEILATNEDGKPLAGSFSLTITDDAQVSQNQYEGNIGSYFLLQSDLKGNIEDPSWYFKDKDTTTITALDHLLLTQGWIGYKWEEVLAKNPLVTFKAEKGNEISGKLTKLLNTPASNINLTLMSLGKTIFVTDTISNDKGEFVFNDLPYLDSAAYAIKIKNAKGKTALANIFVNEIAPAKDITSFAKIKPWYVNTDTAALNFYQTAEKISAPARKNKLILEGNLLNEVEIKGQVKLTNFRQKTAWDAKLMTEITEADLKKVPRKTLMALLNEKIPAFTIGNYYADGCFGTDGTPRPRRHDFDNFMIGSYLVSHVIIDGTNTHFVSTGTDDQIDNVPYQANTNQVSRTARYPEVFLANKQIFNTLSAEDILSINVYRGCSNYYLDIKTRSGKGPWVTTAQGMYVYRPSPIYIPREFYSPKYKTIASSLPDYRSTIFWDANVVTNENGKAKVSFYAANKPTTYTVKIEGTDMQGRFGYQKSNIQIQSSTSK